MMVPSRYLRIDRGYLWPDLKDAFNARFAERRDTGGLQCRFYRLLTQNHLSQVRDMTRTADTVQKYGMRSTLERVSTETIHRSCDATLITSGAQSPSTGHCR